jgi:hypothetical protein
VASTGASAMPPTEAACLPCVRLAGWGSAERRLYTATARDLPEPRSAPRKTGECQCQRT